MKLWGRHRNPDDQEPEGATIDWSPIHDTEDDPKLTRIMIEHGLDALSEDDRNFALDLLAFRERIAEPVAAWGRELDAHLDEFAPGWRDDMPTIAWERDLMALAS